MSRPFSPQYQCSQPYKLLKIDYSRTIPYHKEQQCPSLKLPPSLSSASPKPTSSSRVSITSKHKEQPWDSPISPLIANIFMEEFEVKALQSSPNPPSMWLRFVDDTFVINKAEHSQHLLQHINNQGPHIQFTVEPTQQGSLPFLDTLVTIQPDNTLSTSVYRKPTHTDQYRHWDSNHHITAKHSVYNTLAHRAKTVSSTQDSLDQELLHIKTALQHCQFPNWALNQWEHRFKHPNQASNNNHNNSNNSSNNQDHNNKYKTTIVVPYIPKTADKFKRLCKGRNLQVQFKGTNTLRTTLVNPKDKDYKTKQTGVIYHYQCPHIQCSSSYIGESDRSLGERVKEHLKAPSPIHLHSATMGHPLDPNQFNIIHKEVQSQSRTIKEAMFICVQDPPSITTLANTNCHTFGTSCYNHHQFSNQNQHKHNPTMPTTTPPTGTPHTLPTHPPYHCTSMWGDTIIFLTFIPIGKYMCTPPYTPLSLSTCRPTAAPSG